MPALIALNELETRRFGVVAAKVASEAHSPQRVEEEADAKAVQLLTVRILADDLARVHAFESAGYRLMDTLVYYSRDPEPSNLEPLKTYEGRCRPATPADVDGIVRVAKQCFKSYMGHYHADPKLDNAQADAAYVQWAQHSALNVCNDAPVFVAEVENEVVGFLASKRNSGEELEVTLNAVSPAFQGRGVYTELLADSLVAANIAGFSRVIISTQINNYRVQRVWARLGFAHTNSVYTLHKWRF